MTSLLGRLAAQAVGTAPAVRPRLRARFEPAPGATEAGGLLEQHEETVAAAPVATRGRGAARAPAIEATAGDGLPSTVGPPSTAGRPPAVDDPLTAGEARAESRRSAPSPTPAPASESASAAPEPPAIPPSARGPRFRRDGADDASPDDVSPNDTSPSAVPPDGGLVADRPVAPRRGRGSVAATDPEHDAAGSRPEAAAAPSPSAGLRESPPHDGDLVRPFTPPPRPRTTSRSEPAVDDGELVEPSPAAPRQPRVTSARPRRAGAAASRTAAQAPPEIHVTIGRIDVRAPQPPQSPPAPTAAAAPTAPTSALGLGDYLRDRAEGRRR